MTKLKNPTVSEAIDALSPANQVTIRKLYKLTGKSPKIKQINMAALDAAMTAARNEGTAITVPENGAKVFLGPNLDPYARATLTAVMEMIDRMNGMRPDPEQVDEN